MSASEFSGIPWSFTGHRYDVVLNNLLVEKLRSARFGRFIARRMLEMRSPIVITLCDLGRISWRRSNVTVRPPSLLPEERDVWRESHESGLTTEATLSAEDGLQHVRCWAIHEPGWKREILRSEIADCY